MSVLSNPSSLPKFKSEDLVRMPDDGNRYEVIDGELYIHDPTHYQHQSACGHLASALDAWSQSSDLGEANIAVGLVFDDYNSVAPDVVWLSRDRRIEALGQDGWLHSAPELVAEVLIPGEAHFRRDCWIKRELYARFGVQEYWIVDWQERQVDVYRHERDELCFVKTFRSADDLNSPLLPGFSCRVESLFFSFPSMSPTISF